MDANPGFSSLWKHIDPGYWRTGSWVEYLDILGRIAESWRKVQNEEVYNNNNNKIIFSKHN